MKKLIISIFLAIFLIVPLCFSVDRTTSITCNKIFDAEEIAASESYTSSAIDLTHTKGYFSIQYEITGDGTLTISYLLSNDGTNFMLPSTGSNIGTSLTKTSGPGSGGKDIIAFTPVLANFIKFKATETGGANSATITMHYAIQ